MTYPQLNQSIAHLRMPQRIARLPISPKGFPIPWFVYIDETGVPDFRVIGPGKTAIAVKQSRCWICGDKLGSYKCFVIGPMCTVNRVSAEPPSHVECAQYAAIACPFLNNPRMRRNEKDLPDERWVAGNMIPRNPGVTALWITKSYKMFRAGPGALFEIGQPTNVMWYAEGRPATRAEVEHSIATGLPLLEAEAVREGNGAVEELQRCCESAKQYLPEASP